MSVGESHFHHLVVFEHVDGVHSVGPRTAVSLEQGFLYETVLGGEHHVVAVDELLVVKSLESEECVHAVVALYIEQVLYCPALAALVALRYFVALEPVAPSLLGEENHGVVHCGRIYIFGEILFAAVRSLASHAAPCLFAEFAERRALDVTQMADGDYHGVVGIEIFGVELLAGIFYLGAPFVAVFLLHLLQFVLHHLLAQFGVVKDLLQVCNLPFQFVVFGVQLFQTETCELAEPHVHDSLRLQFVEVEPFFEVTLSFRRSFRRANYPHHLVDVVAGDDKTFENMRALLRLGQIVLGAPDGHLMSVLHEILHTFPQCEQSRTSFNQSDAIHGE